MASVLEGIVPSTRHYEKSERIFRQGDATFGIFILLKGKVALMRVTPTGSEVTTHTVQPGELFAEASLFVDSYHCDAVAIEGSEVQLFPKSALAQRLQEQPKALWAFAAELAHRVQNLRTRLEIGRIRSASERVLQALRLQCDSTGTFKPHGTLKSFAVEIGLTHEALYRAMARLELEGAIIRSGNVIRLVGL